MICFILLYIKLPKNYVSKLLSLNLLININKYLYIKIKDIYNFNNQIKLKKKETMDT